MLVVHSIGVNYGVSLLADKYLSGRGTTSATSASTHLFDTIWILVPIFPVLLLQSRWEKEEEKEEEREDEEARLCLKGERLAPLQGLLTERQHSTLQGGRDYQLATRRQHISNNEGDKYATER